MDREKIKVLLILFYKSAKKKQINICTTHTLAMTGLSSSFSRDLLLVNRSEVRRVFLGQKRSGL